MPDPGSLSTTAACAKLLLQAVQSRLDALENDNAEDAPDPFGLADGDDDEFVMADSDEDGESLPGPHWSQGLGAGGEQGATAAAAWENFGEHPPVVGHCWALCGLRVWPMATMASLSRETRMKMVSYCWPSSGLKACSGGAGHNTAVA